MAKVRNKLIFIIISCIILVSLLVVKTTYASKITINKALISNEQTIIGNSIIAENSANSIPIRYTKGTATRQFGIQYDLVNESYFKVEVDIYYDKDLSVNNVVLDYVNRKDWLIGEKLTCASTDISTISTSITGNKLSLVLYSLTTYSGKHYLPLFTGVTFLSNGYGLLKYDEVSKDTDYLNSTLYIDVNYSTSAVSDSQHFTSGTDNVYDKWKNYITSGIGSSDFMQIYNNVSSSSIGLNYLKKQTIVSDGSVSDDNLMLNSAFLINKESTEITKRYNVDAGILIIPKADCSLNITITPVWNYAITGNDIPLETNNVSVCADSTINKISSISYTLNPSYKLVQGNRYWINLIDYVEIIPDSTASLNYLNLYNYSRLYFQVTATVRTLTSSELSSKTEYSKDNLYINSSEYNQGIYYGDPGINETNFYYTIEPSTSSDAQYAYIANKFQPISELETTTIRLQVDTVTSVIGDSASYEGSYALYNERYYLVHSQYQSDENKYTNYINYINNSIVMPISVIGYTNFVQVQSGGIECYYHSEGVYIDKNAVVLFSRSNLARDSDSETSQYYTLKQDSTITFLNNSENDSLFTFKLNTYSTNNNTETLLMKDFKYYLKTPISLTYNGKTIVVYNSITVAETGSDAEITNLSEGSKVADISIGYSCFDSCIFKVTVLKYSATTVIEGYSLSKLNKTNSDLYVYIKVESASKVATTVNETTSLETQTRLDKNPLVYVPQTGTGTYLQTPILLKNNTDKIITTLNIYMAFKWDTYISSYSFNVCGRDLNTNISSSTTTNIIVIGSPTFITIRNLNIYPNQTYSLLEYIEIDSLVFSTTGLTSAKLTLDCLYVNATLSSQELNTKRIEISGTSIGESNNKTVEANLIITNKTDYDFDFRFKLQYYAISKARNVLISDNVLIPGVSVAVDSKYILDDYSSVSGNYTTRYIYYKGVLRSGSSIAMTLTFTATEEFTIYIKQKDYVEGIDFIAPIQETKLSNHYFFLEDGNINLYHLNDLYTLNTSELTFTGEAGAPATIGSIKNTVTKIGNYYYVTTTSGVRYMLYYNETYVTASGDNEIRLYSVNSATLSTTNETIYYDEFNRCFEYGSKTDDFNSQFIYHKGIKTLVSSVEKSAEITGYAYEDSNRYFFYDYSDYNVVRWTNTAWLNYMKNVTRVYDYDTIIYLLTN